MSTLRLRSTVVWTIVILGSAALFALMVAMGGIVGN